MSPSRPTRCPATAPATAARWPARSAPTPDLRAGIAYVRLEGNPDPVRVRAAWVSDEDIEAMCVQYAPSPRSTSPVSEMSHERAHDLADRRPVPGLRHR